MSISWQRGGVKPALVVHPCDAASLDEAHAAIEQWEWYSRKRLDSEQKLAVEHMLATRADGLWAARTTGRTVSRQNGKGDEIEVVEAWDLIQRGAPIVHTAHEIPTAKKAHLRLVGFLEGHKDLRRKIKQVRYANGDQAVEMVNNGIVAYRTRTLGGGRGLDDIARVIVDEAQYVQPEHLASSTPILAVNPNPQTNFMGSAGIEGRSDWWWGLRKRALAGGEGSFAWLEHSAERVTMRDGRVSSVPPNPTDRRAWKRANFAYPERISAEYLAEQLELLGPDLFAREHLNVWDALDVDGAAAAFGAGKWNACIGPRPRGLKPDALSVAVTWEQTFATISSAAVHSGVTYVKPLHHGPGTSWVVAEAKAEQARHGVDVVVDGKGPAAALIDDLREAGVEVKVLETVEVLDACADLFSAVQENRVRHGSFPELDAAVAGAVKRPVGDRWAWGRRTSSSDVSPLEAITLAAWWARLSPRQVSQPFALWG